MQKSFNIHGFILPDQGVMFQTTTTQAIIVEYDIYFRRGSLSILLCNETNMEPAQQHVLWDLDTTVRGWKAVIWCNKVEFTKESAFRNPVGCYVIYGDFDVYVTLHIEGHMSRQEPRGWMVVSCQE